MNAIFLDIETTGLNAAIHRPIDIACKIIDLSTGDIKGAYQSVIKQPIEAWEKRDLKSVEINGFLWEEVSLGKDPTEVAKEITNLFQDLKIQRGSAVFICQNPAFDRGFFNQLIGVYTQELLNWPYHWLDLASMYWAITVEKCLRENKALPEKISFSKNDIAQFYSLSPEQDPHRASRGVEHLIACYQAVLGVKFR